MGTGQLVALDMNGRLIWNAILGLESDLRDSVGHGSSPLLYRTSHLLCDHQGKAYIVCVDKKWQARWKVDRGAAGRLLDAIRDTRQERRPGSHQLK